MKVIISSNSSWNIYNFRLQLILELKKKFEVIIVAPYDKYSNKLRHYGFNIIKIDIDQSGRSFLKDLLLMYNYYKIFKKIKPDIFLGFTIKPNIYANFAGFFLKIKFINTVTGLGTSFLNSKFLKFISIFLYKISFYKSSLVIFQNLDDKNYFIDKKIVKKKNTTIINGSGVDTLYFKFMDLKYKENNEINFLFAGRIIRDKGIYELIDSIKLIKNEFNNIKLRILGYVESKNITSISKKLINKWENEGLIEYLEPREDIRDCIAESDCVILPSYREGLSKFLLEAASMGRPIICSDVPGCNSIVSHMHNGILFKSKDVKSLYEAIKIFIQLDFKQKQKISVNLRKIAENKFEQKKINNVYIELIKKISKFKE